MRGDVNAATVEAALLELMPEQRKALGGEAVREGDALHLRTLDHPGRRCALQRRGLVVDRMYSCQLTPLGEAVRAAILRARAPTPGNSAEEA